MPLLISFSSFIFYNKNKQRNKEESLDLSSYIAGLIERYGSIKVPESSRSSQGILRYPSVTIVFVAKDFPLAEYLAVLLEGKISKGQGDYVVISIYKLSALYSLCNLVNGRFRTPKLEALHRLINWLNAYGKFNSLELLPIDSSTLTSNYWLAGFSDSDSNFLITFTKKADVAIDIQLTYRLSQRLYYPRGSDILNSYLPLLTDLSEELKGSRPSAQQFNRSRLNYETNLKYTEKGVTVTSKYLVYQKILINYFNIFPLLSSKHFNYLDWKKSARPCCF